MRVVGKIESLWRYPVKSMRGEALQEALAGYSGIFGDRFYIELQRHNESAEEMVESRLIDLSIG